MPREISKKWIVQVKVIPNAARNAIEGLQNGVLRVRITAIPDKGKANEALLTYFAKTLGIARSRITVLSGHTARLKRVAIEGFSREEVEAKLLVNP